MYSRHYNLFYCALYYISDTTSLKRTFRIILSVSVWEVCVKRHDNIYAPPGGWAPSVKEFTAATCIRQSSSNWVLWYPVKKKCKQTKATK